MNYNKFKIYCFIVFLVCTLLLVLMALLWIWEVVNEEIAWKSIVSLTVIGFSFLFVFVIWQKIFENK